MRDRMKDRKKRKPILEFSTTGLKSVLHYGSWDSSADLSEASAFLSGAALLSPRQLQGWNKATCRKHQGRAKCTAGQRVGTDLLCPTFWLFTLIKTLLLTTDHLYHQHLHCSLSFLDPVVCSSDWPCPCGPPASAYWVLGLQAFSTCLAAFPWSFVCPSKVKRHAFSRQVEADAEHSRWHHHLSTVPKQTSTREISSHWVLPMCQAHCVLEDNVSLR